jgi:ribosomal protein S6--L-glutamate ligase
MTNDLKIGVLAERRYLAQTQPAGMIGALRSRGIALQLIDPEASTNALADDRWLEGLDLIVGRGRSWGLLSLLGWAEEGGVPTINRRAAISAVHNKADMAVRIASRHLPAPETFLGPAPLLAERLSRDQYPLILKPIFGDNCRGLQVIATPDELLRADWPEPVALAQRYHTTDGYDLKLYGIGRDVWAVRKPSPFNRRREGEAKSEGLVETTPELVELGRRCGEIFGLELFGVDCIETASGPLVIEINDFPNYTSVPEADDRLADYVIRRAREGRPQ